MSGAEISFGVEENRRGYAAMRHIRAEKVYAQRRYYDAGRTKKEERKEKKKANIIKSAAHQNRYSEKSTSKTSLTHSRIPCKQFVKYRASKRNISQKTGRRPLYTSPILRILSNFVGKDARNKAHKTPDGTGLRPLPSRYRSSASSHRFAQCKTGSRHRPSGIAPKLCDGFARRAGGRSPSKRAYVKTVCRFACKESGRSAAVRAELHR